MKYIYSLVCVVQVREFIFEWATHLTSLSTLDKGVTVDGSIVGSLSTSGRKVMLSRDIETNRVQS